MKKIIVMLFFLVATSSNAEIVISNDEVKKCTLFRATSVEKPVEASESVLFPQEVYGMITKNLEIDFDNKRALLELDASVILGFNKKITNQKIQVSVKHPDFKSFINTINKKVFQLETICLNANNEMVYFSIGTKK